jgi:hypothetical protein
MDLNRFANRHSTRSPLPSNLINACAWSRIVANIHDWIKCCEITLAANESIGKFLPLQISTARRLPCCASLVSYRSTLHNQRKPTNIQERPSAAAVPQFYSMELPELACDAESQESLSWGVSIRIEQERVTLTRKQFFVCRRLMVQ